ncbi:phosphate signaling complex protein PhoU, partial [Streptomyces sp. NPDC002586]
MREHYHEELESITDGLVEMANLVGSAIGRATTARHEAHQQHAENL